VATSKKQPETSTRRVWRMSANVPLGEFVDIASTAISSDSKADTPHRRATDAGGPPTSGAPDTGQRRRYEDAAAVPAMPPKISNRRRPKVGGVHPLIYLSAAAPVT